MNVVDAVVLAMALFLGLRGLRRGLIRAVFGFAGWLGGFAAAFYLVGDLAPIAAERYELRPEVAALIVFLVTFAVVFVAASLVGWLLSRLARAILLGPLDRLGGLVLGACEGLVLSAFVLFALSESPFVPWAHRPIEESMIGRDLALHAKAFFNAIWNVAGSDETGQPI